MLVARFPLVVAHAIDDFTRLRLLQLDTLLSGRAPRARQHPRTSGRPHPNVNRGRGGRVVDSHAQRGGTDLSAGQPGLLVRVLTVWSVDTSAYLSGRTFKRGRFLHHISPNKTWSGVIGGTVAAVIVAGALAWAAGQWLPGGLLLGLLVAVAGQAGDVAESMLKRTAGAKDSSNLIPGHGGILDRTDSFLFAAPVVYAYLLIVGA